MFQDPKFIGESFDIDTCLLVENRLINLTKRIELFKAFTDKLAERLEKYASQPDRPADDDDGMEDRDIEWFKQR